MLSPPRDLRPLCRLDGSLEAVLNCALERFPLRDGELFRTAACYRIGGEGTGLDALVASGASHDAIIAAFAAIASEPSSFLVHERPYTSITMAGCWSTAMDRGTTLVHCSDFVASVLDLRGGRFAVLGAGQSERATVVRSRSKVLNAVRLLLRANLRLREMFAGEAVLEGADAVFDLEGRLLLSRDPAIRAARHGLATAIRAREAAGGFAGLEPSDGLARWHEFAAGKLVLFDYVDTDLRRYVVGVRTGESALSGLALSWDERLVLERMLLGESNKVIAGRLGTACSTVSETASRALHRLGARSFGELSAVLRARRSLVFAEWAMGEEALAALGWSEDDAQLLGRLTSAEREVAAAFMAGCSLKEIALTRGSSIRTVANHLGACYRKLGVSGRRELMALFTHAGE